MAIVERDVQARNRAAGPQDRVPAVVEFRGVSKTYDSGDTGLVDASLSIQRGEFVFLVGQTGSGKSTIMRLLIKEHEPSSGEIDAAGAGVRDTPRAPPLPAVESRLSYPCSPASPARPRARSPWPAASCAPSPAARCRTTAATS